MTKEERLILVAQLCETASLLILLGALLWNFRHDVEKILFDKKDFLDVKSVAALLISVPALAANVCGIYFLPELWWLASILQWGFLFGTGLGLPSEEHRKRENNRE
jgi:hypothetical protein